MSVETQESITFTEFRAWLAGLIRGKKGALPDLDDWRLIKEMIDKVIPEERVITIPSQPLSPPAQPWDDRPWAPPQSPWVQPNTGDPRYVPPVIWCSSSSNVADNGDDQVKLQVTNQDMGEVIVAEAVDDGLQAAFAMMFSGGHSERA